MELQGEIDLERVESKNVIVFFKDLRRVVPCLPHLTSYNIIDEKTVKASFKAKIGSISVLEYVYRITADVMITLDKYDESKNYIEYSFDGKSAGINYTGKIFLNVLNTNNSVKIKWSASVDIGKRLEKLMRFINIENLINDLINDVIENIKKCIASN